MSDETKPRFNPREHLLNLKGKQYLPVAARIAAFRDECAISEGWGIRTQLLAGSLKEQFALFHAEITDAEGRVVSSGTKAEDVKGFPDFLEKAETGAIGRALAAAGYGTMYALDFDEGSDRIADAPVASSRARKASGPMPLCTLCSDANNPVPAGRVAFCEQRSLPVTHFECAKEGTKS